MLLKKSFARLILLSIFIYPGSLQSKTWYVTQSDPPERNLINNTMMHAQAGDTILVGPGVYSEITIYMKPIHLVSENGPETTTIRLYQGTWSTRVIAIWSVVGECSLIGFTITGGWFNEADGEPVSVTHSAALIRDNIIRDNKGWSGGGIFVFGEPSPIIEHNLIFNNYSRGGGGGITMSSCSPIIRYNTIVYNSCGIGGGGIEIRGTKACPIITNNIIAYNHSNCCGGIDCSMDVIPDQLTIECNDVWNNTPVNYYGSIIDQTGINGNISENPLFCGIEGSGNFYLQTGSPCAASNVPSSCNNQRMGYYPINCEVGIKEESWGKIKSLFK